MKNGIWLHSTVTMMNIIIIRSGCIPGWESSVMRRSRQVKHASDKETNFLVVTLLFWKGENGCEAFLYLDDSFVCPCGIPLLLNVRCYT